MDSYVETLAPTALTTIDDSLAGVAIGLADARFPAQTAPAVATWVQTNVEYLPAPTGVRTSAQEGSSSPAGVTTPT